MKLKAVRCGSLLGAALLAGLLTHSAVAQATDASIPIPAKTWTMMLTRGVPVQTNGWEQLVYAPVLKQSVMFSQYHQRYSEPNESLVGYSFESNSWNVLDMGGLFHTENIPEGGESQGYFGFNPNNNTIVYHCCTTGSNQPENAFHTWWFDVLGQSGMDKHTSPKPPFSALQPGGDFDAAHNVFVMHGGDSLVGTWTYDPVTNAWQHITVTGTAPNPSLILPTLTYNSTTQKMYLFGGFDGSTYYSDLYVYDVPSQAWSLISPPDGVRPPGRFRHAMAYDSTNHVFLLYGGQNASGIIGDTWVFDTSTSLWTQLNPPTSPQITNAAVFARMTYDSDHNVFVLAQQGPNGYFGGIWTAYAMQTWLFRYAGAGPNAGTVPVPGSPAVGSINRNTSSWGKEPEVVASGSSLYAVWSEAGSPFDPTGAAWPHIYVNQWSGGGWSPLGTAYTAISADVNQSHMPSIAVAGGKVWVSWCDSNDSTVPARISAKAWDGVGSWQGGNVGLVTSSKTFQGRSQIASIGGSPYVALIELDKNYFPQKAFAYVKKWDGAAWNLLGAGALNRITASGTTADSIAVADDGTNPYVAWTEYQHAYNGTNDSDTQPQVYVSRWGGTAWQPVGGSLNVNPANWAYDVTITFLNGAPYVAWTERTQTGNAQLYVKTWNGVSWVLVGSSSLNRNATGWAYRPRIVADATSNSLYLAWVESPTLGQKAQVYVSRYLGGWNALGGGLNADPLLGSAQHVSLTVYNGQPAAAWGEVNAGWLRQIYVKQWTGSSWSQLSGNGGAPDTTAPTVPPAPAATALSTQVKLTWPTSSDTVGVAGYVVYRNGLQIGTATSTPSFIDGSVAPNTSYTYKVAAYDAAGNTSSPSAGVAVTVPSSDAVPPTISMTAPSGGSTVGGTISVSANATDNVGVTAVQFKLDGGNLGAPKTGPGPGYAISWDTTTVVNGTHTLTAVASDAAGNTTTATGISVTVSNISSPPVISGVSSSGVSSSGATISWTTDKASDSQVNYGTTAAYDQSTPLAGAMTTSHAVNVTGLAASTTYHYQVLSRDGQGNLTASADYTFITTAPPVGPQPVLLLHGDSTEVTGVTNGATVTPAVAPSGFTGKVVVNGAGSVNFAAGQSGNGVYFLGCCGNTANAYYKFTGAAIGNIFTMSQGQATFYLKSRYSFAQRSGSASSARYAFDVRDGSGAHLFFFLTQVSGGRLLFTYAAAGTAQYYYAPQGGEDTLFGSGVAMKVALSWDGSMLTLALNGTVVKSTPYTAAAANWTAVSNFDLGAYEYLNVGGYSVSDDVIDEFSVFPKPQ